MVITLIGVGMGVGVVLCCVGFIFFASHLCLSSNDSPKHTRRSVNIRFCVLYLIARGAASLRGSPVQMLLKAYCIKGLIVYDIL